MMLTPVYIELQDLSWVALGSDNINREFNEDTEEVTVVVGGQRKWVVQVRVVSMQPGLTAFSISEKISKRIFRPGCLDQLNKIGLAVIETGTASSVPFESDNNVFPSSVFELSLGFASNDDPYLENWVESVDITEDLE